ncbi:MAG: response regulator [Deltaproteobacteria bacterium]|nr:response regulator [Deltaproteobacteria bacterium]
MKRERILIVEDELDMLDLIDFNLTRKGYITAGSLDGIDAVKKIRHFKPDLVVLDLMLPEMDGWKFCKSLRQKKSDVPIVMLTAKAMPEDRMAGFEIGADDYITKPFNVAELILRIERLLKRKSVTET